MLVLQRKLAHTSQTVLDLQKSLKSMEIQLKCSNILFKTTMDNSMVPRNSFGSSPHFQPVERPHLPIRMPPRDDARLRQFPFEFNAPQSNLTSNSNLYSRHGTKETHILVSGGVYLERNKALVSSRNHIQEMPFPIIGIPPKFQLPVRDIEYHLIDFPPTWPIPRQTKGKCMMTVRCECEYGEYQNIKMYPRPIAAIGIVAATCGSRREGKENSVGYFS